MLPCRYGGDKGGACDGTGARGMRTVCTGIIITIGNPDCDIAGIRDVIGCPSCACWVLAVRDAAAVDEGAVRADAARAKARPWRAPRGQLLEPIVPP